MKDEELKLEEIEASLTRGDATLLSYTLRYVSVADLDRLCQFGL